METPQETTEVTAVTEPTKVVEEPLKVTPEPVKETEPETPPTPETVKVVEEQPKPTPKVETVNDYIDSNKAPEKQPEPVKETEPETVTVDPATAKLQALENLARNSLIKASNVHPDLIDDLPSDIDKLQAYLGSERFQRVNKTLLNVSNQTQVEKTVVSTPPTEQFTAPEKAKTFGEISSADKLQLGKILKDFI